VGLNAAFSINGTQQKDIQNCDTQHNGLNVALISNDTQHQDIQHSETQHNDTQHNGLNSGD
jgi:hypothetical protein